MTDVELVIALRGTESRSKRALLDEAADRLEQLATEVHKGKGGKMDAVEFIRARDRMMRCEGHAPTVDYNRARDAEEVVSIVEQWAKEHPIKTRQAVFLGRYPYAELDNEGYVRIKPCALDTNLAGYLDTTRCGEIGCVECRRNYWMQEVE